MNTAPLLPYLEPAVIDRGHELFHRNAAEITDIQRTFNMTEVSGNCLGSQGDLYHPRMAMHISPDGVLRAFFGHCSCPYGVNCKHTAALYLTYMAAKHKLADNSVQPGWKRDLDNIFSPARPGGLPQRYQRQPSQPQATQAERSTRLALLFDYSPAGVRETRWGPIDAPASLSVELVRPTKNQINKRSWAKTDVSFHRFLNQTYAPTILPAHEHAAQKLTDAFINHEIYFDNQHTLAPLTHIDNAEPLKAIASTAAEGIELVDATSNGRVIFHDGLVRPYLALHQHEDGAIQLTATLHLHAAGFIEPELVLGYPGFGAVWRDETETLHLARFTEPASEQWRRLHEVEHTVRIPDEDKDEFEEDFLDRLDNNTPWTSPDKSFTPGPPPAPHLRLDISTDRQANHPLAAEFTWYFVYGRRTISLPDAGHASSDPRRNADAEQELLGLLWFTPRNGPLHGAELLDFFHTELPRLEQLGVDVHIDDAAQRTAALTPASDVDVAVAAQRGANDWFGLDVQVMVDQQPVPIAQLIAALNDPHRLLILDNGTYADLNNEEYDAFARLLEEARALGDTRSSRPQVPRVRTSFWDELEALESISFTPDEWLRTALDAVHEPVGELAVPAELQAELRPYQETGFRWLAGLNRRGFGGVLADDMGLGKTLQVLSMIVDSSERPWLVVAPTSVVSNWARELAKFTPHLKAATVNATSKRREKSLSELADDNDIVITSYTLLRLEAAQYQDIDWAGVILDEAQHAKNPASKIFSTIRDLRVAKKFAITGTPIENSLSDAWSMFSLTTPGLLGNVKQFREHFERPISRGDDEKMEVLRQRTSPFLLRRRKADVALDLPPIQTQVVPVELATNHRKLYDLHFARERQRILGLLADDPDGNRIEVLAAITRLRQLAIDPQLAIPDSTATSSKLRVLDELLESIVQEGHRVLIFSQFTTFLRKVREHLEAADIPTSYLDGQTKNRQDVIDEFSNGDNQVFLISLKAGGVGLNLTSANYVILLYPWWNPAAEQQSIDRAHRIGQKVPVTVFRLVSMDTIEDQVVALQDSKRELMENFLEPGQSGQTGGVELNADVLRELFDAD